MSLGSKAIEILAVNAVKNSIVTSEYLEPFISENDKEPSWDGFIYIYGDKSKKKSTLKGRMPVQVKGKECDDLSNSEISYSMSTTDLRNYLNDKGCVLFVVYIGNSGMTKKIYYSELTPLKLRRLLDESKKQASKTIHLKEFPCNGNEKATIFLNCLQNCQKQASFTKAKLLNIIQLKNKEGIKNIFTSFSGVGYNDLQTALINNELYLYANTKDCSIPQPIDIILKNVQTSQVIDALITIDNRIFYEKYTVIKKSKETEIRFGDSFNIVYDENNEYCEVSYKNSDKIRVLAKDLDFILSYIDKGYFKVNETIFLDSFEKKDCNFEVDKLREHLIFAKKTVRLLDILNCTEDINISDINEEDWGNLENLIQAFVEKKPITGIKGDVFKIGVISVGKLKFLVYLIECQEKETYEIFDFFKADVSVFYEKSKETGVKYETSQFYFLCENDFLTLSNIDFDVLLPSFKKAKHNSDTFFKANSFLIELLKAYDKAKGNRKEKIFKTCLDFSSWISEATEEELDHQIKTLNILQTIKRLRDFNDKEICDLYSIVEDNNSDESCIVGAYLLLGQQRAAEIHFARLSENEQKCFKEYPIYHFWKKGCK